MTHHPHVHMIVPGGGIALDGKRWVACRPGFFMPVRVLSRLFRRLFLKALTVAHKAGRLSFFGNYTPLADAQTFGAYLAPLRKIDRCGTINPSVVTSRRSSCIGALLQPNRVPETLRCGAPSRFASGLVAGRSPS
jgi:hypothetical protein